MLGELETCEAMFHEDEAFSMLQELAANTPESLRQQRAHFRLAVKAPVVLQAANASDLRKFKVKGVTGDVSQGGCSAVFPLPVRVGDVFRLHFDRQQLDLPLIFARCVRCRLLREDAFEAGFSFFTPVCFPENVEAQRAESETKSPTSSSGV